MKFWNDNVLSDLENVLFSSVDKAQYKTEGVWHDCLLISKGSTDEYKYFQYEIPTYMSGTITALRFIDSDNNVLGEKVLSVNKAANRTFSFRIKFKILERTA